MGHIASGGMLQFAAPTPEELAAASARVRAGGVATEAPQSFGVTLEGFSRALAQTFSENVQVVTDVATGAVSVVSAATTGIAEVGVGVVDSFTGIIKTGSGFIGNLIQFFPLLLILGAVILVGVVALRILG